jgi:hypothetical protein
VFLNLDAGNENQWLLFDFIKGKFTGNILIPKSDVCLAKSDRRIRIWQRRAVVICASGQIVNMTFYNQFITTSSEDIMHFVNQSKTLIYNQGYGFEYGFVSQNDFCFSFPLSEVKWNVTIYHDIDVLIPRSETRVVRILARKQFVQFIGHPQLGLRIAISKLGSVWEGFETICGTIRGLGDNEWGSVRKVRIDIKVFGHEEGMHDPHVHLDKSGNIVDILTMNSFSEKRQSNYMLVKSVNYYSEMAVIA